MGARDSRVVSVTFPARCDSREEPGIGAYVQQCGALGPAARSIAGDPWDAAVTISGWRPKTSASLAEFVSTPAARWRGMSRGAEQVGYVALDREPIAPVSGAGVVLTAMNRLHRTAGRYALGTMSIGVGQGTALIVERF